MLQFIVLMLTLGLVTRHAVAAPTREVAIDVTLVLDFATGTGTGTFTATGAIEERGSVSQRFWTQGRSLHGVETLVGAAGTLAVQLEEQIAFTTATTASIDGGFVIIGGTGAYAALHGAGQIEARLAFDPEVTTFTLTATYAGHVHPGA